MLFDVKELRKGIEHEYIGFSPTIPSPITGFENPQLADE